MAKAEGGGVDTESRRGCSFNFVPHSVIAAEISDDYWKKYVTKKMSI